MVMRVAVVCKDALVRDGVLSLLAHEGAFNVAGGGEQVSHVMRMLGDDSAGVLVVIADALDSEDWVQLAQAKSSGKIRVVLLVSSSTSTVGQKMGDAVVRRSEGAGALIQTVRRFIGPTIQRPVAPVVASHTVHEPVSIYGAPRGLTKRELEVAQLVAQGMPNRRIASVLQLQEQSIKNLVSSVMRKLDCENRVQVALRLSGRPSPGARK